MKKEKLVHPGKNGEITYQLLPQEKQTQLEEQSSLPAQTTLWFCEYLFNLLATKNTVE